MSRIPYKIIYIIPIIYDETDNVSLCGFNGGIRNISPIFNKISLLPNYIYEFSLPSMKAIQARMVHGESHIIVCNLQVLEDFLKFNPNPFKFIFTTELTFKYVNDLIKHINPKPSHISYGINLNSIPIHLFTLFKLRKEILRIIRSSEKYLDIDLSQIKKLVYKKNIYYKKDRKLIGYRHNLTIPNEHALLSQRYSSHKQCLLAVNLGKNYQSKISESANHILHIKNETHNCETKNDFILALPSIYSFMYKRDFLDDIKKKFGRDYFFIIKSIFKRKGYVIETDKYDINTLRRHDIPYLYIEDINLFTSLLSVLSCQNFAPSLRLPNNINLCHDKLTSLVNLSQAIHKNGNIKINRIYNDLVMQWSNDLEHCIIECIHNAGKKGIIIADQPLEWMCIQNDIPLMITHNVCRINSTPGNLLVEQICNLRNIILLPSQIAQILILRSFKENDPLKNHLSNAIEARTSSNQLNNLNIIIKDIYSESDLINCLNTFTGKIVVFDCHGSHGGRESQAWLHIGKDKIDVWQLKNKINFFPPIFFLSACSTHPLDGSHASVANGLLASGAYCILATMLPVNAIHSAAFISKIFHWIDFYMAIPLNYKINDCWRDIISKILKTMYMNDILMYFTFNKKFINRIQFETIGASIIQEIMYFESSMWFEKLFDKLSNESNKTLGTLYKIYKHETRFTETLYYTHLGRPDMIKISHEL